MENCGATERSPSMICAFQIASGILFADVEDLLENLCGCCALLEGGWSGQGSDKEVDSFRLLNHTATAQVMIAGIFL